MILCQTCGGAVVHGDAVLAQHEAVAGAPHGQFGEGVAIDHVEESGGIRALHVDLAQCGHIADPDRAAGLQHLAVHALTPMGFAGAGEPLRAQPHAHFDKDRALFFGPEMAGGLAGGPEIRTA